MSHHGSDRMKHTQAASECICVFHFSTDHAASPSYYHLRKHLESCGNMTALQTKMTMTMIMIMTAATTPLCHNTEKHIIYLHSSEIHIERGNTEAKNGSHRWADFKTKACACEEAPPGLHPHLLLFLCRIAA